MFAGETPALPAVKRTIASASPLVLSDQLVRRLPGKKGPPQRIFVFPFDFPALKGREIIIRPLRGHLT
jgi:hypothetical protein